MQKIGIKKLKYNKVKYFSEIKKSKIIEIDDIFEVNSVMINTSYIDTKLLKNSGKIRLTLKIDIKIVYLKKSDSSLYVYKKSYIEFESINIPSIFNGYYIEDSSFLNKLKKEIFIENIHIKIVGKNVILSYFIILNLKVKPTDCIAYVINNGFGDNIFLSHKDGQNLNQKTYFQNINFKNIEWSIKDFKLWFLGKNLNKSYIYNIDTRDGGINELENINEFSNIDSFILKNKNELIIESNDSNHMIYNFNLRKKNVDILTNTSIYDNLLKPFYDKVHKYVYFLSKKDYKNILYRVDANNSLDLIFDYLNVIDYYVSFYLNKLIIKAEKENILSLFELDIESKFVSKVNLNIPYKDILDIKYLIDSIEFKQIILLCKLNNTNDNIKTLLLYDFKNFGIKEIITGDITTFDIDYEDLSVFVVYKKGDLSIVDKFTLIDINKNIHSENILKIPAYIKEISLKKV